MQSGFDMTVEWAFDRYSFGRPLASYQALKHRFADMMSWLEASHAISAAACTAAQGGNHDAPELVSAAKAYIGQYGAELVQDCVQLHGGIGVTFEHDLHLYLRRLIVDSALAGTPADHRQRIAAMVTEREREGIGGVSVLRVDQFGEHAEMEDLETFPAPGPGLHPIQSPPGHARRAAPRLERVERGDGAGSGGPRP